MNGWVLIHKKIWDSDMFTGKNKVNRMIVWIWLLTHCDKDGVVTFGRKQISSQTGLSEQAIYRVLVSLRQNPNNNVSYKANSEYTTITILKWHEYQRKANNQPNNEVNNNRTTSEQQPNTNKEVKNKRIKEYVVATTPSTISKSFFNRGDSYKEIIERFLAKDVDRGVLKEQLPKFISYWTELNKSGTKQRWEMEKTFEVEKRLQNWLSRIKPTITSYKKENEYNKEASRKELESLKSKYDIKSI
jgi:hypothetical protein